MDGLNHTRKATLAEALRTSLCLFAAAAALPLLYQAYRSFAVPPFRGYAAVPIVYAWTVVAGSLVELLFLPSGKLPPSLHRCPLAARSLADFWGSRWNRWVSDYLFTAVVSPLRRRPGLAVVAVFLVSGLIHELTIDLTLYLASGKKLFGMQLGYFAIQGVGFGIDRSWLYRRSRLRRVFLWMVVLAPAPLFCNEALLRILHLWP